MSEEQAWRIVYTSKAIKEKQRAYQANFENRIKRLLNIIREDPYAPYPPFEKLVGDLDGLISRRINRQHRMVYMVYQEERTIKIVSLWSHYEQL
jgi:toxin YoeB